MKIKNSKVVSHGMDRVDADVLFGQIEGFAAYSFNKSHAVAYSLISYMAAYLKAHYAGAFYAASMSVLDDDKVKLIAKEATNDGFIVMPPDINHSTASFEVIWDKARGCYTLYSPLTAVKNVSAKVCQHVVETREAQPQKRFDSYAEFDSAVQARKCNKTAKLNLDKVGAFASLDSMQIDPLHPDRLRDQKALMGALAVSDVKPDRVIDMSPIVQHKLQEILDELATDHGASIVAPSHGAKPKFVVITDKPHFFELEEGKAFKGKATAYIKTALKAAGLKPSDGYYTHLFKAKPDSKELTKEEIAAHGKYLKRELALLRAPVVLLAGTKSIRYLFPDTKGSAEDLARQVEYVQDEDCSYMFCINPQMVYIKPDKQTLLNEVFSDIAELFDVA
jgi:DNA polymerase III subunit alpha